MKKIGLMTLLLTASFLFTLAFPAGAAAPKTPAAPVAAPAPQPPALVAAMPDRHPHIHEALESMRAARQHLEQAEPIFQGHREEAIKHLDMAIHEAEICEGMK